MKNESKDNVRKLNEEKMEKIVDMQQPKVDDQFRNIQMQETYLRTLIAQQQVISGQLHNVKTILDILNTKEAQAYEGVMSYLKSILNDMTGTPQPANGTK